MHIVSNIALITINETIFVQLFSFLVFLFIINRLMFRPIQQIIKDRNSFIEQQKRDVEQLEDEYKGITREIEEKEAITKNEAFKARDAAEAVGNEKAFQIMEDARIQIAKMREKTNKEIDAQLTLARQSLAVESEVLSLEIITSILGRGVSR